MSQWYCHACASALGLIPTAPIGCLTGSNYQFDKYIKHTAPTASYGTVSVFLTGSYEAYKDYVDDSFNSGSVEDMGNSIVNIVWCAHKQTGLLHTTTSGQIPTDSVKVVLAGDTNKVHAYPTGSAGFNTEKCCNCSKVIVGMP